MRDVKGHKFEKAPMHITVDNSWCPYCRFNDERECIDILEKFTKFVP